MSNEALPLCGYDVGGWPYECRCLLPHGHTGLHACKHVTPQSNGSGS